MNDRAFWEKYEKRKTWSTKSRMLSELFYSDEISTLNKLSKEILESNSSSLKEEGIKVIKVLEQKFKNESAINEQEEYQKLLSNYKIQDFTNFWFKDFKIINDDEILNIFEDQIQTKYDKGSKGKFKLSAKINLGKHLYGYAFLNIGMRQPYEFSHLAYGYMTDLVDFNGKMLNRYPFTQIHKQQISSVPYRILSSEDGKFRFNIAIKKEVSEFYSFFENHYESLAKVKIDTLDDSIYITDTKKLTNDNSNLWSILSLMNVAKNENDLDDLSKLALIGKELIGMRSSGSAWIEYFNKYDK